MFNTSEPKTLKPNSYTGSDWKPQFRSLQNTRREAIFFIPESAEVAIELLRNENDPDVRGTLLLAIGKNGQASHLPILTPLQQRDALLSQQNQSQPSEPFQCWQTGVIDHESH